MTGWNDRAVIAGFDFSTGSVKGLAFALDGSALVEIHLPTDLWTADGVSELNLMQVEGQVHAAIRMLATKLREIGRLDDWAAIGISATHHTAGRIDANGSQIRRAICWNDQTLEEFRAKGLARLGGMDRVQANIGGPWPSRYSLSHLVKDESTLTDSEWSARGWILPHGPLVAGYMTGRFDVTSVSSAASTGIMDLRSNQWCPAMLDALADPTYRRLAMQQLPRIVNGSEPIGPIAEHIAREASLTTRPIVFPTNDDQQAGLIGGGAVEPGELAIILGNSAVVNSSAAQLPSCGTLDAMRLNWGPYLWMRCYNNGAQFLDHIIGKNPNWSELERQGAAVAPGCDGVAVMPFVLPEPSRNITNSWIEWHRHEPRESGVRYRAALEALAYLVAIGVMEHEAAGQPVHRVVASGGIAKSRLLGEILASVLGRSIETLASSEGPALGAAVAALWAFESTHRRIQKIAEPYGVRDAVAAMVRYGETIVPNAAWTDQYRRGLGAFESCISERK